MKFFLVLWKILAIEGVLPIFYINRKFCQNFKTSDAGTIKRYKCARIYSGIFEKLATKLGNSILIIKFKTWATGMIFFHEVF